MDEIKRKLKLIDEQLAGRGFHARAVGTCPLVFVAVGLMAGILIQSRLDLPVTIFYRLLGLLAGVTVMLFIVQQLSGWGLQYVTAYSALVCFACFGAIRLTNYHRPASDDIRNFVIDERRLATIRGRIITEPYVNRYPDWKFARFKPGDPSSSFYLQITEVDAVAGWVPVTGTVRVQVGEPVLDLKSGDNIQAYCWLDKFKPPTNPGQFDTAGYLARRNIFVAASVKSRDGIEFMAGEPADIRAKLRTRLKHGAATALLGDLDPEDTNRGLLQALLLGNRRDIDSDTYRAFSETGLLHFISLSGMHMGILFGIIWWASRIAGLMKPARAAICAVAIGIFLLVVPPRAPTLRAAIICWVFCASVLFHRHSNSINTLSLAVTILLLIRPSQLFEAGWQLSFACVFGIILFAERIEVVLPKPAVSANLPFLIFTKIASCARKLFAVGFAAWLGAAGVLLYHFHTINPLASVWTVLVFPFVCGILILGFLKMILFFLLPTLSGLLGLGAVLLSSVLVWIVRLIAQLDISQILIGKVSLPPALFYYCIVVFAGYVHFRRPLNKRLACAAMLAPLIVYLGMVKLQGTHQDGLIITCLDVGHGQAVLVQMPQGAKILFDAGSLHRSNIGTRIVAPFLDHRAIGRIDAIVISHNDVDHINGIPEIVKHCKVGGVYANDAFFSETDKWGTVQFLTECLCDQGFQIERLGDNPNLGGAKIEILWPNRNVGNNDDLTDNDRSLVSLIEFAGTKILLCSDIEEYAQRQLLGRYPDLEADIVIIPHHGSARTLDTAFLDNLDAEILICSCDQTQYERAVENAEFTTGTPSQNRTFYTAAVGAITVVVGDDGSIETTTFAK